MNIANRIQQLRKTKGISQEELANLIGVSRQAVSKWESEQSIPDIDKVIALSDYFQVSTDYLLKGEMHVTATASATSAPLAKILYIASPTIVLIGLFFGFGNWYEKQTMLSIAIAMMIQAVGIATYFVAKLFSATNAPRAVKFLNIMGVTWIPVSLFTATISVAVFHRGTVAPYPTSIYNLAHIIMFALVYASIAIGTSVFLRK